MAYSRGKPYSHMRFNLFESCPAAFRFKYIEKAPEMPSRALLIGRLIHDIIAKYEKHLVRKQVQTDITTLPGLATQIFYKAPNGLTTADLDEVQSILEAYAQAHALDYSTVVSIEEMMKFPLLDGKVNFWAVIDLLQINGDLAIITDHKTDHQVRSKGDIERDPQLAIYCWAVRKAYPQVERFKVGLDFVRHGVTREAEFDLEIVEKTESRIFGMIDTIERERKFEPRPGAFCSMCGYIDRCQAAKDAAGSGPVAIATPEDARVWAGRLAVLEAQAERIKNGLKGYCNVAGVVEANGLAWGYHKSESKGVVSTEAFIGVLSAAGEEATPYLSVGATELKKALKNPKLAAALGPVLVDKSYTTFKSVKTKGDEVA